MALKVVTPQSPKIRRDQIYADSVPKGTVVRPYIVADALWMCVRNADEPSNRWMNLSSGYLGDLNGFLTGKVVPLGVEVTLMTVAN